MSCDLCSTEYSAVEGKWILCGKHLDMLNKYRKAEATIKELWPELIKLKLKK